MATVWLWRIEGVARVPNVLGTMEDPECQAGKKVARRQVTSHWSDGESSTSFQELAYILQLRYIVFTVAAILGQ